MSPSHQKTLALQAEVVEVKNPPAYFSPCPPTLPAQDFSAYLAGKRDSYHMVSYPQTLSSSSFHPKDFGAFCSSLLGSTCDVHEDQVLDRVGVGQPTYATIFYEYVWDIEQEYVVKDDLVLSAHRPL